MTTPPTSMCQIAGIGEEQQPAETCDAGEQRQQPGTDIVHDAAAALAQAFQADGHGQRDADLQRDFGEAEEER
jgi:hypothetical protein